MAQALRVGRVEARRRSQLPGGNGSATDRRAVKDDAVRWSVPRTIPRGLRPVPPFVGEILPSALAPWVEDTAERIQCPPDFVAVGAVVAAAAVIGRQIVIRPKRVDDWTVVPNLWGLAVGRPGVMKSAAMAEALKPLEPLIDDARIAYARHRAAQRFRQAEQRAREQALTRRLRQAFEHEEPTDGFRYAFEAPETAAPGERRAVFNRLLAASRVLSARRPLRVRFSRWASKVYFCPLMNRRCRPDTRAYSLLRTWSRASPRWRKMWNLSNRIRAWGAWWAVA